MVDEAMVLERMREAIGDEAPEVFAVRAGFNPETFAQMIRSERRLNTTVLAYTAEATGRSVEWFLYGTEPVAPRITFCSIDPAVSG